MGRLLLFNDGGAHLIAGKAEYHLQNMTLSTHALLALLYYIF